MKKEVQMVVYDDKLHIEAYRFEGIVQPFSLRQTEPSSR